MGVTPAAAPPARVGLLGGAFDPPHRAHVALVHAALAQLQLDRLLLLPTGQAWHKPQRLSPARHRLAMLELAVAGIPKVQIDARETRRTGPSYSLDTLRELRAQHPSTQWVLIIGADQLRQLARWHGIAELLQLTRFAVAWRAPEAPEAQAQTLAELLAPWQSRGQFEVLHLPAMAVSATAVRERLAQHQDASHLLSAEVARYIQQNHLYQTD